MSNDANDRLAAVTQTGYVDVDGVRLAWSRSGRTKPSLLLAHGITDSAESWDRVAHALAQSYDVVRFDARGHGASDRASNYLAETHTHYGRFWVRPTSR